MSTFVKTSEVPFKVFRELVDRLGDEHGLVNGVLLHYDGSSSRGTVTIEKVPGCSKEYQHALKVFTDIYCK